MEERIISKNENELIVQFKIQLDSSMMKTEENIQQALNQAGCLATKTVLSSFDSNGDPINVDGIKYTSKGQIEKKYQTPFGEIELPRHVYQSSKGGKTYCPLENDARIIIYSTPKFANWFHQNIPQMVAALYKKTYLKTMGDTFPEII